MPENNTYKLIAELYTIKSLIAISNKLNQLADQTILERNNLNTKVLSSLKEKQTKLIKENERLQKNIIDEKAAQDKVESSKKILENVKQMGFDFLHKNYQSLSVVSTTENKIADISNKYRNLKKISKKEEKIAKQYNFSYSSAKFEDKLHLALIPFNCHFYESISDILRYKKDKYYSNTWNIDNVIPYVKSKVSIFDWLIHKQALVKFVKNYKIYLKLEKQQSILNQYIPLLERISIILNKVIQNHKLDKNLLNEFNSITSLDNFNAFSKKLSNLINDNKEKEDLNDFIYCGNLYFKNIKYFDEKKKYYESDKQISNQSSSLKKEIDELNYKIKSSKLASEKLEKNNAILNEYHKEDELYQKQLYYLNNKIYDYNQQIINITNLLQTKYATIYKYHLDKLDNLIYYLDSGEANDLASAIKAYKDDEYRKKASQDSQDIKNLLGSLNSSFNRKISILAQLMNLNFQMLNSTIKNNNFNLESALKELNINNNSNLQQIANKLDLTNTSSKELVDQMNFYIRNNSTYVTKK